MEQMERFWTFLLKYSDRPPVFLVSDSMLRGTDAVCARL